MYNAKAKPSAILAIVCAGLWIGFLILLPFLPANMDESMGWPVVFLVLVGLIGYAVLYASALPFVIVALIFGIKMLRQQSRQKLISYNVRLLIADCVLLPFLAGGLIGSIGVITQSKLGFFPTIFMIAVSLAYLACLAAQIVTIAALKRTRDEGDRV